MLYNLMSNHDLFLTKAQFFFLSSKYMKYVLIKKKTFYLKNRPAVLTMEKMEKDRFLSRILLYKMTSADFLESHLKILIQIFVFLPSFHTLKSFVLPISVLLPNC